MIVTCGVSHTDPRIEARLQAARESKGETTGGGCGRALDLSNPVQQAFTYRCVECGRWLCKPCIVEHFAETKTSPSASAGAPVAATCSGNEKAPASG